MSNFDYAEIKKNLYDYDMIEYNDFVAKEWKRKEENDEFNLICQANQIPYEDYYYGSSESEEEEEDSEVSSPESETPNLINPYRICNPYIEEDIYNKNDDFIIQAIKYLLETGKDDTLMNKLLYIFILRLKNYDYDYDEIYDYLVESLIIGFSEINKIVSVKKLIKQTIKKSKMEVDKFKEIRNYEKPIIPII